MQSKQVSQTMVMAMVMGLVMMLVVFSCPCSVRAGFPMSDFDSRPYPNLVWNGSFEDREEDIEIESHNKESYPDDWQERPNDFEWVNDVSYDGDYSWRAEGNGDYFVYQEVCQNNNFTQKYALKGNTSYKLSARIRCDGVSGTGLAVSFTSSGAHYETTRINGTTSGFVLSERTFTTGSSGLEGHLRLIVSKSSGIGWFDDVQLYELDGSSQPQDPGYAAAPVITVDGVDYHDGDTITHTGPIEDLEMSTTTPNGVVRFTIDGRKPMSFHRPYRKPFPWFHSGTIRACTFHAGYRRSPETNIRFELQPITNDGVPFYPVDWDQDIEDWWAGHPANPASPLHVPVGSVPAPVGAPTIHVSGGGNVGSTIDSLGSDGGVIILDGSSYGGWGTKFGKSHVHIVKPSGTATITGWVGVRTADEAYTDPDKFNFPVRDWYFKNIHFDGNQSAYNYFGNLYGMWFDNCSFEDYRYFADGIRGNLLMNAKGDATWLRNCTMTNGSDNMVYYDGTYGSGFVGCDCQLQNFEWGGFRLHLNNDMVFFSAAQRTVNYFVVANSTMTCGNNRLAAGVVHGSPCNMLFIDNEISDNQAGNYILEISDARYRPMVGENIYEMTNMRLVNNAISGFDALIESARESLWMGLDRHNNTDPKYVIRGNTCTNMELVADLEGTPIEPVHEPHPAWDVIATTSEFWDVLIEGNSFTGSNLPQIKARNGLVKNTYVYDNEFFGTGSDPLLDESGGTAEVTFNCNMVNGSPYGSCVGEDACAPTVPENLSIDYLDYAEAILSWDDSTDNVEVTGYRVYRNGGSVGTTDVSAYTDETVACCSSYTYTVTAFDARANESGTSLPATGSTGPAPQDPDLVANGVVDEADLAVMANHWLDSGCGVAGDLDGSGEVTLDDLAGLSAAWTGPDTELPTVPTGLVVDSVTDSTVALDWADSDDNVGVTGYRVFRDSSSVGTTAGSAYTDSGLANETAYTYTVSAFDGSGNESGQSAAVVATTQTPVTNLLLNGSFETGGTWPDNWSQQSWLSWDSAEAQDGSQSIKSNTTSVDGFITQNITLPATGNYVISAWFKTNGIPTAGDEGLFVRYANLGGGGGDWGTYGNKVEGTTDWVQRSAPFTAPTVTGRVDCYWSHTSGEGWIDNVVLEAD